METPTKVQNPQRDGTITAKNFFKNDFYYLPKGFLIPLLETSIGQL